MLPLVPTTLYLVSYYATLDRIKLKGKQTPNHCKLFFPPFSLQGFKYTVNKIKVSNKQLSRLTQNYNTAIDSRAI